jgi:hypothetical protein
VTAFAYDRHAYHSLPVVGTFVAAVSLAMALAFFFAAFLPVDFSFLRRMAVFVAALRFLGMQDLPSNRVLAHSDSGTPRKSTNACTRPPDIGYSPPTLFPTLNGQLEGRPIVHEFDAL